MTLSTLSNDIHTGHDPSFKFYVTLMVFEDRCTDCYGITEVINSGHGGELLMLRFKQGCFRWVAALLLTLGAIQGSQAQTTLDEQPPSGTPCPNSPQPQARAAQKRRVEVLATKLDPTNKPMVQKWRLLYELVSGNEVQGGGGGGTPCTSTVEDQVAKENTDRAIDNFQDQLQNQNDMQRNAANNKTNNTTGKTGKSPTPPGSYPKAPGSSNPCSSSLQHFDSARGNHDSVAADKHFNAFISCLNKKNKQNPG